MTKLTMSVRRYAVTQPIKFSGNDKTFHGIYVIDGSVEIERVAHSAGEGFFARGGTLMAGVGELLHFTISKEAIAHTAEPILSSDFELEPSQAIIRLDQVTFPAGARAYRHIHPGAGIRYLVSGQLEIKSDHDKTVMKTGSAWFEDANSPVQATAADVPETSFIRILVLPVAYEGKPTIKLLNPDDEALPKLQTNKRFFDQRVQF